jgi:hypothetical protein
VDTVYSIASVDKVYDTMSRPFRVLCNDYKHYVAKFGRGYDLLHEYLSARFCNCWNIPTPEYAFVNLNIDHLPVGYNRKKFNTEGFGSEFLEHAQELSQFLMTWKDNQYELGRICNKEDLIKIGLFDLWIGNEDRNHNNANLLLQPRHDGYYFIAIDHVNIFNTGTLDKGLVCLSEDESILKSEYIRLLFKSNDKLKLILNKAETDFIQFVKNCKKELTTILNNVPVSWKIDIQLQTKQMECLFSEAWAQEILSNFRLYIARNFT